MQHGAALFSGVLYSQGSGAYQSSVRNRSKLVVNSVGKPANMLVNQGVCGIIANFDKKRNDSTYPGIPQTAQGYRTPSQAAEAPEGCQCTSEQAVDFPFHFPFQTATRRPLSLSSRCPSSMSADSSAVISASQHTTLYSFLQAIHRFSSR